MNRNKYFIHIVVVDRLEPKPESKANQLRFLIYYFISHNLNQIVFKPAISGIVVFLTDVRFY